MTDTLTNPNRPLRGKTVLIIDGRRSYAETLRLVVLHCGARARRADSLELARRHLAQYRPSFILLADKLPDCSPEEFTAFVGKDLDFPEAPNKPLVKMHQDNVWSKADLVGLLGLPTDGVDTDEVGVDVEVVKKDLDAIAELRAQPAIATVVSAWANWAEQAIAFDFSAQYKAIMAKKAA